MIFIFEFFSKLFNWAKSFSKCHFNVLVPKAVIKQEKHYQTSWFSVLYKDVIW